MAAITTVTSTEQRKPQRLGTRLVWDGTITGPASYTTGGDTVDPKLLGMNKITLGLSGVGSAGRVYRLIPQADGTAKLQCFVCGGAAAAMSEVANATNLSAETVAAQIIGK